MNDLKHLSRRTLKTLAGELDISILSNGSMRLCLFGEGIQIHQYFTKDQAKQLVKNIVEVIIESEETSDDCFKTRN